VSGRIGDSLIHQQDGNVIADGIDPAALSALQALALVFEYERFFAHGAYQHVEQILGNHGEILPPSGLEREL
jgi:hypothetical protein